MFTEIVLIDYTRPLYDRWVSRRRITGPYRWRPTEAPCKGRGFYQAPHGLEMDRAGSSFALRLEWANDVLPRGDRLRRVISYWGDDEGFTPMNPIIARLPRGRGFLAGWTMGNGMCASLECEIYETEEDAARAAHSVAEYAAEVERDYQAAEAARLSAEEDEEEFEGED